MLWQAPAFLHFVLSQSCCLTYCAGNGRHLIRLIGCCKDSIEDVLVRFVPSQQAPTQHPMHHHVLTFLTGDEVDITALVPDPDNPTPQRSRTSSNVAYAADDQRTFSVAPWLDPQRESEYQATAYQLLSVHGMSGGFTLGRLKGAHIYGTTNAATGRPCAFGRRHQSNNFYVEFRRSGDVVYSCYGQECRRQPARILGQWHTSFKHMLSSAVFWTPGRTIDTALLRNVENHARLNTPKKQLQQQQDWFPQLEQQLVQYLGHYLVFVSQPAIYVLQRLDDDGNLQQYTKYEKSKLMAVVQPWLWAFKIWDSSHLRTEKLCFVGNPHEDRVSPEQYNLCAGLMPMLKVQKRKMQPEDLAELEPVLHHFKHAMAAGNEEDYNNLLMWMAAIVQDPAEKTGWCPVSQIQIKKGAAFMTASLKSLFD